MSKERGRRDEGREGRYLDQVEGLAGADQRLGEGGVTFFVFFVFFFPWWLCVVLQSYQGGARVDIAYRVSTEAWRRRRRRR
jgi:hypothetical protein